MTITPTTEPTTTAEPEVAPDTIASRVQRGIDDLDLFDPTWADRITLDTLSLPQANRCVLGQVFGDYWDGRRRLSGIPEERYKELRVWAADRGFDVPVVPPPGYGDDDDGVEWDDLQAEWVRRITEIKER